MTAEQIQEIRDAVAPRSGSQYIIWGLGTLFAICLALGTFELTRISTSVDTLKSTVVPAVTRVEERLRTLDRFCCSEVYGDGKTHADVMIDDDPPKGMKK